LSNGLDGGTFGTKMGFNHLPGAKKSLYPSDKLVILSSTDMGILTSSNGHEQKSWAYMDMWMISAATNRKFIIQ
jgi:hypothetical protein